MADFRYIQLEEDKVSSTRRLGRDKWEHQDIIQVSQVIKYMLYAYEKLCKI